MKIEKIILDKMKSAITNSDNNDNFVFYLLDRLWEYPKERKALIESLSIDGFTINQRKAKQVVKRDEPVKEIEIGYQEQPVQVEEDLPDNDEANLSDKDILDTLNDELQLEDEMEIPEPPKEQKKKEQSDIDMEMMLG